MRIIIVDDEKFTIQHLNEVVAELDPHGERLGFLTGDEAIEYLETNDADVAFLDIDMPGMNGLELAKRIKETKPKTNIVFVTGHSEYALEAHNLYVTGFLLKPVTHQNLITSLENLRNPIQPAAAKIRVQAFGFFEVFVNDVPIHFGRSKSKEILAYLVDRRGSSVTVSQIAAILFEDVPYSNSIQKQVQVFINEMMNCLKAVKAQNMVIKKHNSISVNPNEFQCDYYEFLKMNPIAINSYCGEYMSNYSWAELTTGFLHEKFHDGIIYV